MGLKEPSPEPPSYDIEGAPTAIFKKPQPQVPDEVDDVGREIQLALVAENLRTKIDEIRGKEQRAGKTDDETCTEEWIRRVDIPAANEYVNQMLEAKFVPTHPEIFVDCLVLLQDWGEYARGRDIGRQIFNLLEPRIENRDDFDADVCLMRLVEKASWMHYATFSPEQTDEDSFGQWARDAGKLRERVVAKAAKTKEERGGDILYRKQYLVAEMWSHLAEARIAWRIGQIRAHGKERYERCDEARFHCDAVLINHRSWCGEQAEEPEMQDALLGDESYLVVVNEARRMKAMLAGLAYFSDARFAMKDAALAEETAGEIDEYAASIKRPTSAVPLPAVEEDRYAEVLLDKYFEHYRSRKKPIEWWYGCIERARHYKILGEHSRAHEFLMQTLERARQSNASLVSRLENAIADNMIVLGHRLTATGRHVNYDTDNLREQAMGILGIKLPALAATLAQRLFRKAIEISDRGARQGGIDARRIARDTAVEARLNLINLETLDASGATNRRKLLQEAWRMFADELILYETANGDPAKFKDDTWLFTEAVFLARIGNETRKYGFGADIDITSYPGASSTNFRDAYFALYREYRSVVDRRELAEREKDVISLPRYEMLLKKKLAELKKYFGDAFPPYAYGSKTD